MRQRSGGIVKFTSSPEPCTKGNSYLSELNHAHALLDLAEKDLKGLQAWIAFQDLVTERILTRFKLIIGPQI